MSNSSKQFSKLSKSSNSTEYGTPLDLFSKLNKIFKFTLDPATTADNPLHTKYFYTKKDDALTKDWSHNTYINPPFGKGIKEWIYKMHSESMLNPDNQYVMLLPSRTDTKWFQELIMKRYKEDSMIYLLKGRLKFVNPVLNGKEEPHIIGSMLWIKNSDYLIQTPDLLETIPGILIEGWTVSSENIKNE